MKRKIEIKTKFIIDENGDRKEVILSLKDYEALLEEIEDLKDISLRLGEPSRPFTEYHSERQKSIELHVQN